MKSAYHIKNFAKHFQTGTFLKSSSFILPHSNPNLEQCSYELEYLCTGRPKPREVIQAFFHLINSAGVDKHSEFRKVFWRKYLENGHISNAWLVLTQSMAKKALLELELNEYDFGILQKHRRVDDNHCVLLMQIKDYLIAEWSHIGKCRIWHIENPYAPQQFSSNYTREELTDYADHIQQHYFSQKGLWQNHLDQWLAKCIR